VVGGLPAVAAAADRELFDFEGDFRVAGVDVRDTNVRLQPRGDGAVLRVTTGCRTEWPGLALEAPEGRWDLSELDHVAVDVHNVGSDPLEVYLRIDSEAAGGQSRSRQGSTSLQPGEAKTLRVAIERRLPERLASKLFGMRGYPGGMAKEGGLDAAHVKRLTVFLRRPSTVYTFEIDNVRAGGAYDPPKWLSMNDEAFFPMIDAYGQFLHKDWPGKTGSDDGLRRRTREEAADLADHPGPADWNRYGGWQAGPKLEATGHFRVQKHQDKWWLVDPEGRLFWSHGIDCVRSTTGYTPITDRKSWFADLPPDDSPLVAFYGESNWAPHGYYQGKKFETYNFTGANLLRKYGPEWKRRFAEICHQRLRSWGMNTIANWSDPEVYRMQKTPYVATVGSGRKVLEGSSGYWRKFPDVFDPDFTNSLRERLAQEKGITAADPWCIGCFVDNELSWGDELSLAVATLASPAKQVAKTVFIDDLKAKYGSVDRLNKAWGTGHDSWNALLESQTPPDEKKAHDDLADFYRAVRAAAKHCDVISFNRYRYDVADFQLPDGVDKPAIIGEFHFGALDRGMFHTGLRAAASQQQRAEMYRSYVEGALENPWLVGTHWFQYGDQATTGRGDGENYQIGFVDICDTPYPEIVNSSRHVGATMYRLRLEGR
jgi:hypothetical protein